GQRNARYPKRTQSRKIRTFPSPYSKLKQCPKKSLLHRNGPQDMFQNSAATKSSAMWIFHAKRTRFTKDKPTRCRIPVVTVTGEVQNTRPGKSVMIVRRFARCNAATPKTEPS